MRRIFAMAIVLAGACRGPGSEGADGAGGEPAGGSWSAGLFGFVLADGRVEGLTLTGLGCTGPLTAAGEPTCSSLLRGPTELSAPLDPSSGAFEFTTPFGLALEGRFVAATRAEGTFRYVADNGCCSVDGAWEAVPWSPESDGPAPCQSVLTGAERLEIGATVGHTLGAPRFAPLAPGDPIAAVPGFQGAVMLVPAVRVVGVAPGGLELEVEATVEATGVSGRFASKSANLQDDTIAWTGVFLVLEHPDGSALAPGVASDRALVDGQEASLVATLRSDCGLVLASSLRVVVHVED